MPDRCRTCKAPIKWALTETGRLTPLDLEPNPKGEWRLTAEARGVTPRAVFVPPERRGELARELMISHWATCPDADQHRRPR